MTPFGWIANLDESSAMDPLSPADIQLLRNKIERGEGSLEDAMRAIAAIRKSWEAVPGEPQKKAAAAPKEAPKSFSDDF